MQPQPVKMSLSLGHYELCGSWLAFKNCLALINVAAVALGVLWDKVFKIEC